MADTSLIIGNGNWAVKENSLLGYNIIQGKYVPIEMTVSRNTTATRVVNSAGLIELGPKNLFLYSQTFDNTSNWFPYPSPPLVPIVALIVIPNVLATSAPNGTFTADKLVAAATLSEHILIGTPPSAIVGTTYTVSVFAKAAELSRIQFLDNAGSGATANFNLATGAHSSSAATETMLPVGNDGWYRCTMTYAPTLAGTFNIHIKLAVGTGTVYNTSFLGNGSDGVYLWGAQLELGPTATEYFPTTDRFNIPRVDYLNSTTGSLLVEPTRTNSLLYSEQFNNAAWAKTTLTVTANQTTAPDGNNTADLLAPTSSDSKISQGFLPTGAIQYNFSVYLRSATGSSFSTVLRITRDSPFANVANTAITVTTEWQRFNLTFTTLDTTTHQATVGGGSELSTGENLYAWGAQVEAGSNATSYIPTTIQALARNADVISKTGISSLIGQTEGTMFVDFNFTQNVNTSRLIAIGDGTTNNRAFISLTANTIEVFIRNASAIQYSVTSSTILTGRYKVAVRYKQNDFGFYINGVPINTSNSGNLPINLNNFYLASYELGGTANAIQSINSAQLYKTALDNDQCIDLTN